jgi:hypothetical protein
MPIDLTANIVAQYKMNETSGTLVADSSGNGHNGTSANTIVGVAGKIGGAISFNGTSDYVDTNNTFQSTLQNSFTIVAWVQPSKQQSASIVGFYDTNMNNPSCYLGAIAGPSGVTRLEAEYKIDNSNLFYKNSAPTNIGVSPYVAWNQVILRTTYVSPSSCTFGVFVNGVRIGTETSKTFDMGSYSGGNILIGNDSTVSPFYFTGAIDNVCIFNKALSTDEIAFLYNNGNGTEDLKDNEMAAMTDRGIKVGVAPAHGPWTSSSQYNADVTGGEDLLAAVAGKSHYIRKIIISCGTNGATITLGADQGTDVTTPYIGPISFSASTAHPFYLDFGDYAMQIPAGSTFAIDGVTAAPVWIYFEYKTA